MSDKLNDAEFWLPSEFLTEEDIVMDSYGVLGSSRSYLAHEFGNKHGSFTSSTGSTSPVESTETVSEEGDSLGSELTQLLTLLRASRLSSSSQNHDKLSFGLTGSGLSNFTGLKSGSGRFIMPTNGNPNGPFQVSSHATAPGSGNEDAWDLIYKAASQVAKNNGGFGSAFPQNPNHLGPQRILPSQNSSLFLNQLSRGENLLEQELWNTQEKNRLNFEQSYMKRAGVSDLFAGGFNSFSNARPDVGLKNHQLLPDMGAKGGFGFGPGYGSGAAGIGGATKAVKSERVGTGVFLPRRYSAGFDDSSGGNRKKPGYGSVGGIQANKGNLALNNPSGGGSYLQSQPRFMSVGVVSDNDASVVARRAAMLALQKTFPEGATAAINHDVCLPQEWTY